MCFFRTDESKQKITSGTYDPRGFGGVVPQGYLMVINIQNNMQKSDDDESTGYGSGNLRPDAN